MCHVLTQGIITIKTLRKYKNAIADKFIKKKKKKKTQEAVSNNVEITVTK